MFSSELQYNNLQFTNTICQFPNILHRQLLLLIWRTKNILLWSNFFFFLIISITEHLFYLLAINVSIFFKFLFNSLAYFSIGLKHSDFKNSFSGGIKWIPCQQHPKTINKVKLINQTSSKLKGKQKTERQAIQGKTKKHF